MAKYAYQKRGQYASVKHSLQLTKPDSAAAAP